MLMFVCYLFGVDTFALETSLNTLKQTPRNKKSIDLNLKKNINKLS